MRPLVHDGSRACAFSQPLGTLGSPCGGPGPILSGAQYPCRALGGQWACLSPSAGTEYYPGGTCPKPTHRNQPGITARVGRPSCAALTHSCGFCRKFCSEGHDGAVASVCVEITRRESRTVRPQ